MPTKPLIDDLWRFVAELPAEKASTADKLLNTALEFFRPVVTAVFRLVLACQRIRVRRNVALYVVLAKASPSNRVSKNFA